jgi:tRNA threonylcarbamoyladenosine biosynthesis protein TsaE
LIVALPAVADTEQLGAALASSAPRSATDALVVYLEGELGSGKTTLARGLLRQLGVTGTIRSPTYTLLESYESKGWLVTHIDLYRLAGPGELESLGLREQLNAGALVLVEWPERATQALPHPDLRIALSFAQEGRAADLRAESQEGSRWLTAAAELFQK